MDRISWFGCIGNPNSWGERVKDAAIWNVSTWCCCFFFVSPNNTRLTFTLIQIYYYFPIPAWTIWSVLNRCGCHASNGINRNIQICCPSRLSPLLQKHRYGCSRSPSEPVTSVLPLGFCPDSRHAALFPGRIIPFKLHSYLRPVLFPSRLPGGHQTIHLEDFMSPWSAIKASVRMRVLETWVVLVQCRKNSVRILNQFGLKLSQFLRHWWKLKIYTCTCGPSVKKGPLPSSTLFSVLSFWHIRRWHCNQNVLARQYLDKLASLARPLTKDRRGAASPIISAFFDGVHLKGGGCDDKDKRQTTLRENVRAGRGWGSSGEPEHWAVNLRPGRLPSPNLCPDGSAERKSFAPQKSRIKDMPINVLFPLSPANPTSTPPSGCLLMLSSLSFPTQLVWRAPL